MTTLAERLEKALAGPPLKRPADLARACGVRPPSVSDWLSGKTKKMEGANLLAAAEFLEVNYWWLAAGKGPMRPDSAARASLPVPPSDDSRWPFSRIAEDDVKALSPGDLARVEGAIALAIALLKLNVEVRKGYPAHETIHSRPIADPDDVELPFPMAPMAAPGPASARQPAPDADQPFPDEAQKQAPWQVREADQAAAYPLAAISAARDVVTNVSAGDNPANDDFEPVPELPDVRLAASDEGIEVFNEAAGGMLHFRRSFLRQHNADGGRACVVYAAGDSMEPVIPDGAALLLVPAQGLSLRDVAGGGVWAINYGGKMLVKTITRPPGGIWVARSFNRAYPDILLETDVEVRVLGRIVWVGAALPPDAKGQWVRR